MHMPAGTAHGALQGATNDTDMSDADSSAVCNTGSTQQGATSTLPLPTPLPLGRKGHKGGGYHAPKTPTGKGGGGMPMLQGSGPSLRGSGRRDIDEMHAAAQVVFHLLSLPELSPKHMQAPVSASIGISLAVK
eukprot:499351-Pelagomonas_calceolata.AAC.2